MASTGCDWYFNDDDYDPFLEREIIYDVRSNPLLDYFTKKALILCWFDTVYGEWAGLRFDNKDARARMSSFLKQEGYSSYEEFLGM